MHTPRIYYARMLRRNKEKKNKKLYHDKLNYSLWFLIQFFRRAHEIANLIEWNLHIFFTETQTHRPLSITNTVAILIANTFSFIYNSNDSENYFYLQKKLEHRYSLLFCLREDTTTLSLCWVDPYHFRYGWMSYNLLSLSVL